jgi:hypothetical protein
MVAQTLFVRKVYANMEGCVFPFITSLIAFALLDLLVRGVKLTWMNVQVSRAIMVERALTPLKVIVANVLQASLDYSVMRKTATVTKYHMFVQNVLCVETNQD